MRTTKYQKQVFAFLEKHGGQARIATGYRETREGTTPAGEPILGTFSQGLDGMLAKGMIERVEGQARLYKIKTVS